MTFPLDVDSFSCFTAAPLENTIFSEITTVLADEPEGIFTTLSTLPVSEM